jgi:hypothetical protein
MHFISIFEWPQRMGPWIASLWQGDAPDGLIVRRWLYLGERRECALLEWETSSEAGRAWLEARMAPHGNFTTWPVADDATVGMMAAMRRDLDQFAGFLGQRRASEAETDAALDLRRRGLRAASLDEAAAAGSAWDKEQQT